MTYRLINLSKNVVSIFICFFCIPLFIREWFCRNHVTILLYHDIAPKTLAKHLIYLSRHFNAISLDRLVSAIRKQDFSNIPAKSVVLTFDDGHVGNYSLMPIIKKHRINPTIYVCTQIINTHRHFWFKLLGQSKTDKEFMKRIPNTDRLAHLKEVCNFEQKKEYQDRQALNIVEIKEMMSAVDFQPHTQFHPILPHCSDQECEKEILSSKVDLEKLLDIDCLHFSYPNGDYTQREIRIVKASGYRSARTTDLGWNNINTSPYKLKAIPISDDAGLIRLRAEMTTIPQRCSRLANSLLIQFLKRM